VPGLLSVVIVVFYLFIVVFFVGGGYVYICVSMYVCVYVCVCVFGCRSMYMCVYICLCLTLFDLFYVYITKQIKKIKYKISIKHKSFKKAPLVLEIRLLLNYHK